MNAVLSALRDRAAESPAAPVLRDHDGVMSYAELYGRAQRVAEILMRHEIRVLALAADNSPEWVVVDFAAQIANIALVPLPLYFSREQIRHVLADSSADAVAVDGDGMPLVHHFGHGALGDLTAHLHLWRIRASGAGERCPEGTAKLSYTSGTTGRPKGVCLRQDVMDRVAASLSRATASIEIRKHVCLLPLATLLENIAGVYAPLIAGAEIVLPNRRETGLTGAAGLDTERLVACLHAYAAESVILLPQMLAALVAAAEAGIVPPPTLRFAAVGGGCVARSLLERADRLALPVYEGYGLTECASVVALNTPEARRQGSVGRPLDHVVIRIGAASEIFVRGAAMAGYAGERATVTEEIATGDCGYLDAGGFLHIDGRRKNIFITSFGRNVSPDWVEAEVAACASIAQVALFGEARPWNVAVIVPRRGAERAAIAKDIESANAALPDYARVHQWLVAREPFSAANGLSTTNGRNRRAAIWARYRAEVDACYDECVGHYA